MRLRVLVGTEGDHDEIVAAAAMGKQLLFAAPKNSGENDPVVVFTPHGLVARATIIESVPKPNKFRDRPSRFFKVGDFQLLHTPLSLDEIKKKIPTWRWPAHPRKSFCTPEDAVSKQIQKIVKKNLPAGVVAESAHAPDSHAIGGIEGQRRERLHSRLERDSTLIARAKKAWLTDDPTLACFTCGFSFLRQYGVSFIEAPHRVPLASLDGSPRHTTLADLVGVCANCHRMLHREQALSPESLRDMLKSPQRRRRVKTKAV